MPIKKKISFDRIKVGNTDVRVMEFPNRRTMETFAENHLVKNANSANKETWKDVVQRSKEKANAGDDWYGKPLVRSFADLKNHTKYLHFDLLKKVRPVVKKSLRKFLEFADDKALPIKKIAYNDREIGVFSFDRAAMGLRKVNDNGQERIISDVKKSYAYHEPKSREEEAVKIFMIAGGNANITGEQMTYTGIGSALVAEMLVDKGFQVEVNVIFETAFAQNLMISYARVKKYENEVNLNDLMLMTASPRYFRYKGFRQIVAACDNVGWDIPGGLGHTGSTSLVQAALTQRDKENAKAIVMNPTYSEEEVINEIKRIINELKK